MDELLGEELKVWADKLTAHERLQGKIEEILQRQTDKKMCEYASIYGKKVSAKSNG